MGTAGVSSGWCRGDRGATAAEYGLLVVLIVLLCIGLVSLLGIQASDVFDGTKDGFDRAPTIPAEPPVSTPGGGGPGVTAPTTTSTTSSDCPPDGPPPTGSDCSTSTVP